MIAKSCARRSGAPIEPAVTHRSVDVTEARNWEFSSAIAAREMDDVAYLDSYVGHPGEVAKVP
jgi:hypothetical protein